MRKMLLRLLLLFGIFYPGKKINSQNLLYDGNFSTTTSITPYYTDPPPLNMWLSWANYYGTGASFTTSVENGVCSYFIDNPGTNMYDVQLTQYGFPMMLNHRFQLSFDVKADADRDFGVFIGEFQGSWTNFNPSYIRHATSEWQTISIDLDATAVFALNKLSFEMGILKINMYFANISLTDQGPIPIDKVVLPGTFQDELGCPGDWMPECDNTALTYNESSGLWEGTFNINAGCWEYKVAINGSWNENYGEGGLRDGPNIVLYVPEPTSITFLYDPVSHLVTSTPYSGSQLKSVSLVGDLQTELGCNYDWSWDCTNSQLAYDKESGNWTGKFNLPAGCYSYTIMEMTDCGSTIYGEGGIAYGYPVQLYHPSDMEITFTYNPETHIVLSSPHYEIPAGPTKVSLYGTLQSESGCNYDFDFECGAPALNYNPETGKWEGTLSLPPGCYSYYIKETVGCNTVNLYGENGTLYGNAVQLYLPEFSDISFSYDPDTHIINSSPYAGAPTSLLQVSLVGDLQSELGCAYDFDANCDNASLTYNEGSGKWEATYTLPAGCYAFQVKEVTGCNIINFYGQDGILYGNHIQLYLPETGDVSFSYDPVSHIITTSPYGPPSGVTGITLYGNLQSELGCTYDFDFTCTNSALTYNESSGKWEGKFILPEGCYYYTVKETTGCDNVILYGENGQPWGNNWQLYIPSVSEVSFSYDPQTHIITSTPYSGFPLVNVSLVGDFQLVSGCNINWELPCDKPALNYNPANGLWEGSFDLEAGCYKYIVKQSDACGNVNTFGADGTMGGNEFYNYYQLFVPYNTKVDFVYDPVSHLISSDYNQVCPPNTVVIAGNFQSELGCHQVVYGLPDGDWEPACDLTRLTFDPVTKMFTGTFNIPAGNWEYKVTYNNSWAENYGLDGLRDGPNIPLRMCAPAQVTFKYDYNTHLVALEFDPAAICIVKFYDANVNGINDDGIPLEGVKFTLSGTSHAVQFTDNGGRTVFSDLSAGEYTVTETLDPGWVSTTFDSQTITLIRPIRLVFGNVCLGPGGGHPISFWMNKKGEVVLKEQIGMDYELMTLRGLNLRNADGSDFDPYTYDQLKKWLQGANAKNMAYMLSAQMAALQLAVDAGFVKKEAFVYAPVGSPFGTDNFLSVEQLLTKVNAYIYEDGYTPGNHINRPVQEFLKDVLEEANSNMNFVQPLPCNISDGALGQRIPNENVTITELSGVRLWPNPSNGYFTLRPANKGSNENVHIRVVDVLGRQLYTAFGSADRDYQFGKQFRPGIYFVEVLLGSARTTIRIVKQ